MILVMSDATQILQRIDARAPQATEELFALIYSELRTLAAARLNHEPPGHSLEATALVHEAYLRLVGEDTATTWDSRGHFFSAAAEAMRRILVERARQRNSLKRGGASRRVSVDSEIAAPEPDSDLESLNEALSVLESREPRVAEVIKLRCFTRLTIAEVAEALEISPRSAARLWAYGRAWLANFVNPM